MKWIFIVRPPEFSFSRITLTLPSSIPAPIIYGAIYLSIFYIYIGGVYDLLQNPLTFATTSSNSVNFIASGINRQFLLEGIVGGILMFTGAIGLYLIRDAATYHIDRSQYISRSVFGYILTLLAFVILTLIMDQKL